MRPRSIKRVSSLVTVLATMAGLIAVATPAGATFSGPVGRIAFAGNRSATFEVYSITPGGGQPQQITHTRPGHNSFVSAWSPDGTRVAFDSDRTGDVDIFVSDADGSNVVQLTDNQRPFDGDPSWSPDGQRIVFASDRTGINQIYTMAADGSDVIQLTDSHTFKFAPQYSPDGLQVVFGAFRAGKIGLFLMGADGSNIDRIVPWDLQAFAADWSPDGTKIAFANNAFIPTSDLFVLDVAAHTLTQLTFNDPDNNSFDPTWSPDGQAIAYVQLNAGEDSEIFRMRSDGTHIRQLTFDLSDEFAPAWGSSP